MKIKRAIYFIFALTGAGFLFASNAFRVRELGLALGFSLLMLGLYGLSRGNLSGERGSAKDEADETL